MPNIKSAMKRVRSDRKKRAKNQMALSELHTLDQKMRKLTADPAGAEKAGRLLIARFDRAVSRGIIPRGRADRKKSRIEALLAKLKAPKKV
ncbi:MAG: 30S ribosomal protein S20 [Candidatus Omnitrophota bacterium]